VPLGRGPGGGGGQCKVHCKVAGRCRLTRVLPLIVCVRARSVLGVCVCMIVCVHVHLLPSLCAIGLATR
jgi:hypothetical protein